MMRVVGAFALLFSLYAQIDTLQEYATRQLVALHEYALLETIKKLPLCASLCDEVAQRVHFLQKKRLEHNYHDDELLVSLLSKQKPNEEERKLFFYLIACKPDLMSCPLFRIKKPLFTAMNHDDPEVFLRLYASSATNIYDCFGGVNILEYAIMQHKVAVVEHILTDKRFDIKDSRAHANLVLQTAQSYYHPLIYQAVITKFQKSPQTEPSLV